MIRTVLLALLLLLPSWALAEGARLELACDVVTLCDAGGTCGPSDGQREFVISPSDIDDDGFGAYDVNSGGGNSMDARGLSRFGPFLWMPSATERVSLTVTGDSSAVLTSLDTGAATPDAKTEILTCEVTF